MKRIELNTTTGRHVDWLELFYDLIYVVVIARLTHIVLEGHDGQIGPHEYLVFFTLFVPVWWSWIGHTMFENRFGTYDAIDRLLALLQMFFAVMLALAITDALGTTSTEFALAYAATRWALVLMYLRVYLSNPEARPAAKGFIFGFGFGSSLWIISIFFPPSIMFSLWIVGLAIEMITPFLLRKTLKPFPVHNDHLPERTGLFAILVLGESILGLVTGAQRVEFSTSFLVNVFLAFSVICAIWWLYFETLAKALTGTLRGAAQLHIYGHLHGNRATCSGNTKTSFRKLAEQ